jgi:hypothetical protein
MLVELLLKAFLSILGLAEGRHRNFELLRAGRTHASRGRAGQPLNYSESTGCHCRVPLNQAKVAGMFDMVRS